jgi:aminopeptidase N
MPIGNLLKPSLSLVVIFILSPPLGLVEPAAATILQHDLTVELRPSSHELQARDHIEVEVPGRETTVTFTLAPSLRVESVLLQPRSPGDGPAQPAIPLSFTIEHPQQASTQRIGVKLPSIDAGPVTLIWSYRGVIDDPPKEPRHLRFVTPSETAGHIGPEGAYLSSESQWYPDIEGSLSTFRLSAGVPTGWTVVTQGKQIDQATRDGRSWSTWVVKDRSEALTLVANKFVAKTHEWNGRNGQRVELATYFFPDNAGLADEYLDATAKYLDAYVPLLGDYPFEKFAVVENFFASGLGMPSFTLLGSGSIKRHYVQPYALGHEIVHSWIGNSVFNRSGHGNWVEGLTTYLANYYWHELVRDWAQAREQRRLMIDSYSLYVTPEEEYPVAAFTKKSDEKDSAIGYQKAAFVFHLLRHEIGEEPFWRGLKTFVSRFRNRPADWGSLESVFAQVSGRDLRWFFAQWVEQGGAPVLALEPAAAEEVPGTAPSEAWRLAVTISQGGKPFRLKIPLEIETAAATETRWISIGGSEHRAEVRVAYRPSRVRLDPELMVFRRMTRAELPPMLNGFVTDRRRTVLIAFRDAASPLSQVAARLTEQESQPSEAGRTVVVSVGEPVPATGSLLVLAGAEQRQEIQALIRDSCGDRVTLEENGFQIDGQRHNGPALALLVSCPRANAPGSVVTILYGVTPQSVAKVSRLLFYYGWHSVVVFQDGAVVTRAVWETSPDTKEVQVHANR